MTIVRCDDNDQCIEEFRSGSVRAVITRQLECAGWQVIRGSRFTTTLDLCPFHKRAGGLVLPSRRSW